MINITHLKYRDNQREREKKTNEKTKTSSHLLLFHFVSLHCPRAIEIEW